jgi:hypothetical protein
MFSFIATPKKEIPITAVELEAIFRKDGKIDVAFET